MALIATIVEQLLFLKQAMYFLCTLSFNHNKVGMIITIAQIRKTLSEEIFSYHQRGSSLAGT